MSKSQKKDDKPQLEFKVLQVPEPDQFVSVLGNKYIRERQYTELVQKMIEPDENPNEDP